ncbi:hypothetical protein PAXRUDRAFT_17741 [Paxillus rubicundulus Ve08.2h10]|uniref:Unplaced genomic scaffold scaffold_2332, whole genome shotgun sequence n=1 Tax=Paxillus rubicundulus Ve08.2h10 TaxID=930991 RepID=A0A0D0DGM4_9AGAM|nr:hypothetical protein PAXRUDRAFT_17741 [Paxillus rubicundulus Ve08.2h10]
MSSSITNNLAKLNAEQLCKHKDNDNELFKKKSVEHRRRMKVQKEAEHQRAEAVVRQKAEEEAKQKAEVEAWRRAEVEAKVCAEEVKRVQLKQSSVSGPSKGK